MLLCPATTTQDKKVVIADGYKVPFAEKGTALPVEKLGRESSDLGVAPAFPLPASARSSSGLFSPVPHDLVVSCGGVALVCPRP